MLPSVYAENYLHLTADLHGQVAEVAIDKYLNAGIKGQHDAVPHPNDYRANRAIAEKDRLLGAIKNDLHIRGHVPQMFEVDSFSFKLMDVVMPFFGKGSPSNIRDVLYLAAKYNHLAPGTAQQYCNQYLGLDCNGFVGNFWGINPSTAIAGYDNHRRHEFDDVASGDALIFYHAGTTGSPYHIAAVDSVQSLDGADARHATLNFTVTQSAGLELGVHTSSTQWRLSKSARGEVIYSTAHSTVYVVQGPPKGEPRGQDWSVSDA